MSFDPVGWAKTRIQGLIKGPSAGSSGYGSNNPTGSTAPPPPPPPSGLSNGSSTLPPTDNSFGSPPLAPPGAPGGISSEQRQANADADVAAARTRSTELNDPRYEPTAGHAPVVTAPKPITAAQAGAPGTVTAGTVASKYDPAAQAEIRAREQAHADYLQAVINGTAGASAAERQMALGNAQAIAAQSSLAAGHKGYSTAALRAAGRNTARLQQENNAQTGVLRAQEAAQARGEYAGLLESTRGQDISTAGTEADLALRGDISNQGTGLEAGKANQAAKLQTDLTNAGFNQAAILQMSDQDLKTKLANAGFQLTQEQIDELRHSNWVEQGIKAEHEVLTASGNAVNSASAEAQWRADIQLKIEDAKRRGDAAAEKTWSDALAMGFKLYMASGGSDRRMKKDIEEVDPKDAADFKKSLASMYSYRYKDPAVPGAAPGEHFGPMAQDLEKSKIGRSLVITGPDGMKRIDTDRLVLALASTVAASAKKGR